MKRFLLLAMLLLAGCANDSPALPRMLEFHDPISCPPCREMEPIVKQIGGIKQIDVTTSEGRRMADRWSVASWPTFIRLDSEGREAERLIGKHSLARLRKFADGIRDTTAEAREVAKHATREATKTELKPAQKATIVEHKANPADMPEPRKPEPSLRERKLEAQLDEANRQIDDWKRYKRRMEDYLRRHGHEVQR